MSSQKKNQRYKDTTIQDIADRTGFAASTVSRAINNPERVNYRTRDLILNAAKELNYISSPNSSPRTNAVAVLVSDITNPFYFDIIRGSQHELKTAGYMQLLVNTDESAETEASILKSLTGSADGAILTASRLSDSEILEISKTIPIVAINRTTKDLPSVIIGTPSGFSHAVDHLVALGHKKIFYVSGPKRSWSEYVRYKSVVEAAKALNVEIITGRNYEPTLNSGAAAADAVSLSEASACIVFNDLIAIGMLARFNERNIKIPQDISVVGCDDIFGASFCSPPLTTITAPAEQAGRSAVTSLLARINSPNSKAHSVVLPTHLTIRKSTSVPQNIKEYNAQTKP